MRNKKGAALEVALDSILKSCTKKRPKDYDYFGPITKSLPKSRDTHSHGTSSLDIPRTIIFEITQTILNKIYF